MPESRSSTWFGSPCLESQPQPVDRARIIRQKMRDAGRTQVSVKGEPSDWLNPAHPENFQLEVDSMLEVVEKISR